MTALESFQTGRWDSTNNVAAVPCDEAHASSP
eukprot:CAMPEP_0180438446 /NCGR_PEP_ID=MMETSP1036_2-20121128/12072_1 /TAXON_ID=632150 /ORGANISM="Azadinium spinosum, Strain 3D9" /LENGTH=31 /DNA_ID= /DNA_START= /DNA_END= /DNA_ORIENTATION=